MNITEKQKQKIFSRFTLTDRGCWEWNCSKDGCGYGTMRIGENTFRAHRIMWTIVNGEIPQGVYVLHRCDNPSCIRPDHLWLGTQLENIQDMHKKGRAKKATGSENGSVVHIERMPRGINHYMARVTPEHRDKILSMRGNRATLKQIADTVGLSLPTVHRISTGAHWINAPQ